MGEPTCVHCSLPCEATAYVAQPCALVLAVACRTAAALWPEVDVTVARQSRMGDPGPRGRLAPAAPIRPDGAGGHYGDQEPGYPGGLVVDLRASDAADAVRNTVTTWGRHIGEERGTVPPTGTAELLGWLADQTEWIRHRPEAGEMLDELTDAARGVARIIDRPADRVYAGPCAECQANVYAVAGAASARCPRGHTLVVAQRQAELLAGLRTRRVTATEAARMLTWLGVPTTASVVRNLAARHPTRLSADDKGRYLLGEVERQRLATRRDTAA